MKKLRVADKQVAEKYLNLLKSAERRSIEFKLTFSDIRRLLQEPACYYTGTKFIDYNDFEHDDYKTIDRIDNDKGYVKGNVVACTNLFNKRKSNLTVNEITHLYLGVLPCLTDGT